LKRERGDRKKMNKLKIIKREQGAKMKIKRLVKKEK
jgi:hypothetical protein